MAIVDSEACMNPLDQVASENKMIKILRIKPVVMLVVLLTFSNVVGAVDLAEFDGSSGALDAYTGKGKWVVLKIWAHDCYVCNKEAHEYVAFHKKHKDKDAVMLGLSMDGKKKLKKAKAFMQRHKIQYTTLLGEPEVVAGYYQNKTGSPWIGTPTFMIFDPSGKLAAESVGAVPTALIEQFIAQYATSKQAKQ